MSILEVIGIASILPFMKLVAEPEAIVENAWLSWAYQTMGFASHRSMLITAGLAVIALISFANLFSIYTIWLQHKYSWAVAHTLSLRLLRVYLQKPYRYYLTTNTSTLRTYLLSEVVNLTGGVIIPLIELVSRLVVSLVIFTFLIFVNPLIAITTLGVFGGFYLLIYLLRQHYVKRLGMTRIKSNTQRYQSLEEMMEGIKTVKVYEAQGFFYDRYKEASKRFTDIMPKFNIFRAAPRYVLEVFAFGGILAITLYLFVRSNSIQTALPILSLYAVAGYRLLPALQKAFGSLAKLRHNFPVLDKLYDDLMSGQSEEASKTANQKSQVPFIRELMFKDVAFYYDERPLAVLENLQVRIPKGQTVAFVGSTGSGKTTIVDMIAGLLFPQEGQICVDDTPLTTNNAASWHQQIAYVPQEVFLFDDALAQNITICQERDIDQERLRHATQMANIYDFIQTLPDGFATRIGERGVRLSGGQRQRLGLARALYRQPSLLILDEATSALDNQTEKGIMDALNTLPEDLTIIIIAHRFSTVRKADCIYLLEEGKIVAQGTYDDLMKSNAAFRTLGQLH